MTSATSSKVTASHLARNAYLYVRQSTVRQVFENQESTKRQYALRQRAVALGWAAEQVVVIDQDQGQSGASAAGREGFQRLVTEVSLGHAGMVLGLEVSRLARNSSDWHRLLEICALADTLILDEEGVYDPTHFNDRLLLGLKGTMSEAELHVLRSRLRGGILNKAHRGELRLPLPVGFVYGLDGRVQLDPDEQVQRSLRLLFETFRRTGSALATVKHFAQAGLLFPKRLTTGAHQGELAWSDLGHSRVVKMLHNPRYAGAFAYGQQRFRRRPDGHATRVKLPREEWTVLLPDAHPGYISWVAYESNLQRLSENAQAHAPQDRRSPPREGPALLQGLVVCGRCGRRMTVRYDGRGDQRRPVYVCQQQAVERGKRRCQHVPGHPVDTAVGELLIEVVTPMALEVALSVQQELESRSQEADRLRRGYVERARYEAELAQRRYLRVDPENRLVADTLEGDWNKRLRALREAEAEYERQRETDQMLVDEQLRSRVLALATDFPRLWQDTHTSNRDRKRMLRLLVEDVTIVRDEEIAVHVRFRAGTTRTLQLPAPLKGFQATTPHVVAEVDRLLDDHTDDEVAALLNERGMSPCDSPSFALRQVRHIRRAYGLESRRDRLRAQGYLTVRELATKLDVHPNTIRKWYAQGLLSGQRYGQQGRHLFEEPDAETMSEILVRKLACRPRIQEVAVEEPTQEVQCEA